ncbi:hypothetical protein MPDQ_007594 [Monascus purpureus]|uniref:Uncharacterized protein n=1 Tax=Monascus purpureus TaxID=5098 RepID=A0A507QVY5_MONPU|nr:hypothetical protein MPDQ_007594 [Monascus purpureus]
MSTCLENIAPAADISGYTVSKAACLKLMDYFAANSQLHGVHLQPRWAHTDMNGHQKQAQDVGLDASRYGLEQQIQEARLILERPEFQNYLYDLETDQLQNLATFEKARIQQREDSNSLEFEPQGQLSSKITRSSGTMGYGLRTIRCCMSPTTIDNILDDTGVIFLNYSEFFGFAKGSFDISNPKA